MLNVALLDYGMGNLRSVSKAIETFKCKVRWVNDPSKLKIADVLVLPGVGAFSLAVKNLKKLKLFDPIQNWIAQKKPFLGICLGYQLLFEKSQESEEKNLRGLEIFKGEVVKFKNKNLKIPHMGWNQIQMNKNKKLNDSIFSGIKDRSYFYFVHSYYPDPKDPTLSASKTDYCVQFSSSISTDYLFASQFHPEKSGKNGLKLIQNFLNFVKGDDLC
ncbi:MAG: imidazole glycerol phosphate synthase, glutamine amidotransferase subunit [Elusimicrobia bacterium RIFCSPLOWO2_02_FULL_39_32]|nr:MAG: imidazole glycerol phosphate synthase, glutamine amidotransferase subunit [Elusimicrobia bacterium GWA2_38_7]OGR79287.1 MAG: imidazole glycerol phosphate synthase, glutamine amidotransferase subunit [Elusimicrobia bacterium RIFCSPHIGHO2_02_FULL_39_36]OGR93188.1 MAG: imidazole glycerol phosphate synthase, glutamine amidotransferase subunit [Elusimicrobia bacterium RIFCSPLOWO2_02_FULL_39_32]OGR99413.1 MAG: imidazole glycerol phosphate synthase, glutamine amidotransferase subunit [Elusimicr